MRKFTLSVAAALLSMSAIAADLNVTVDHKADEKKVYLTFSDYSHVVPGLYSNNFTCKATLNDTDVTYNIMPTLDDTGDYGNVVYFDYMMYMPALMNGGVLADGEYTLTFSEGFFTFDYASSNEEPIVVNFTVGNTTGISMVESQRNAATYNLQGQKVSEVKGFTIINGKKAIVK